MMKYLSLTTLFWLSAGSVYAQTANAPGGGPYPYYISTTAGDNHANICAGPTCKLSHVDTGNSSGVINYIRFYNAGAGFNGCGSATGLFYKMTIPGNTAGAGYIEDWALGLSPGLPSAPVVTGISICITSGNSTTDTTNATPLIDVNIGYQK